MQQRYKRCGQYRSGFEARIADELTVLGIPHEYEPQNKKVHYLQPAKPRTYLIDFLVLSNRLIIETKGEFTSADRVKHLLIKEQHPELDIRFLFANAHRLLRKGSPTTYAMWCDKHGFKWAHRHLPQDWIQECLHADKCVVTEGVRIDGIGNGPKAHSRKGNRGV